MTVATNPDCIADHGKPCAACESDWSKVGPIPTERCLMEPGVAAPRVTDAITRACCYCNHCYFAGGERRRKEKEAAPALADALEDLVRFCAGLGAVKNSTAAADTFLVRARAALRAAGRIP